ncbi:MAG: YihY/virulence factor BrkB family protein [Verrucomicrobiales bacterium]|nr:YihY/virulence factor BrkB family protein [Verrucomicrobiales bacterium]
MTNSEKQHGRQADFPHEIPRRGWWDIAYRLKERIGRDNLGFISAGVAFYLLMGFIPTLAAVVALYGLFADPGDVERQMASLQGLVPPEALQIFEGELKRIASNDATAGWATLIALSLAIWGGSQAMDSMITALNLAYDECETRGYFRRKFLGLGLTIGLAVSVVLTVALLASAPVALHLLGWRSSSEWIIQLMKWPLLLLVVGSAVSLLYRYAPDREDAKWRWITPGAVLATVFWGIGSVGFSWYVSTFANYSAMYGSLGGIVILLFWFYITGFVILLGAEVNAEVEHQTARDSTTGPPLPLGDRGAYVADHVGVSHDRS